MKKLISILLILAVCAGILCGCGQTAGYGVSSVLTLVSQDYSLAFRNDDPVYFYVTAALEVLAADGTVDRLASKWFGQNILSFDRNPDALSILTPPEPRTLIIGLDINSFPMAYISSGTFWGFDVELANAVCAKLGWALQMQSIEKEDAYIELSSGNIDCAWGGIVITQEDLDGKRLTQYGPYAHNDIVIAARAGTNVSTKMKLNGKTMCMSSTSEAMDALNTDPTLSKRLGQVTRLAGGTTECFENLYAGKCDVVLTDSTAIYYFNCH
ncbi:MAG: transporter substrate-binding domain-containing protein [Eubacteriales bacterium]|nr:transporter substrate-binding domain-containing protein [Eubacteriales bacterium]